MIDAVSDVLCREPTIQGMHYRAQRRYRQIRFKVLGAVPHKRADAVTGHDTQTRQRVRKAGATCINLRLTAPVDLFTIVVTDAATAEMSCAEPVQRFHP